MTKKKQYVSAEAFSKQILKMVNKINNIWSNIARYCGDDSCAAAAERLGLTEKEWEYTIYWWDKARWVKESLDEWDWTFETKKNREQARDDFFEVKKWHDHLAGLAKEKKYI